MPFIYNEPRVITFFRELSPQAWYSFVAIVIALSSALWWFLFFIPLSSQVRILEKKHEELVASYALFSKKMIMQKSESSQMGTLLELEEKMIAASYSQIVSSLLEHITSHSLKLMSSKVEATKSHERYQAYRCHLECVGQFFDYASFFETLKKQFHFCKIKKLIFSPDASDEEIKMCGIFTLLVKKV